MTTNNSILIVMAGYKDKNIANSAKLVKDATTSDNFLYVFDQHPIDHKKDFADINGCEYEHKIWDDILGPAAARWRLVYNNMERFSHVCIVSPDIALVPGWDTKLISMLEKENIILSGAGKVSVLQKDLFSLKATYKPSEEFNKTQMIDRNFIFAKTESFASILLPDFLKYHGENEYLSLSFLSRGYDIVSVPSDMYIDSGSRQIENTYHTFSLEHKYNLVVDLIRRRRLRNHKLNRQGVNRFLEFHNVDPDKIHKLPYSPDDVLYDPYNLEMNSVDARRFIAGTKAIY